METELNILSHVNLQETATQPDGEELYLGRYPPSKRDYNSNGSQTAYALCSLGWEGLSTTLELQQFEKILIQLLC